MCCEYRFVPLRNVTKRAHDFYDSHIGYIQIKVESVGNLRKIIFFKQIQTPSSLLFSELQFMLDFHYDCIHLHFIHSVHRGNQMRPHSTQIF